MKKLLMIVVLLSVLQCSFGAVGLGINYVGDFWKASELNNKQLTLDDNTTASLVRSSMSNPSGLGAFVVIGLSKYEVQVDAEYVTKKYTVNLTRAGGMIDSPSMTSSRVGLSGTIKYRFFSIPAVDLFAGAGAGLQYQTPIAGVDLVKNLVKNSSENFSVSSSDLIKNANKFGYHVMVQARVKPPMFPIGLQATLRGLIMPNSTFEKPGFIPNLMVGVGYFPF